MSMDEKFQAAVQVVKKLPKTGPLTPSKDEKLRFYSLYKQATVGPVNTPRPPFYQLVEKAKWDAWSSLSDMAVSDAKQKYVEELLNMLDAFSKDTNLREWLAGNDTDPELPAKLTLLGR